MFSLGLSGHCALSTLLETSPKDAIFETSVKQPYITRNTKFQKVKVDTESKNHIILHGSMSLYTFHAGLFDKTVKQRRSQKDPKGPQEKSVARVGFQTMLSITPKMFVNLSETHFWYANSSRRILWCVRQLLVVTCKLSLMSSTTKRNVHELFQHKPRNPNKSDSLRNDNDGNKA